MSTMDGVMAANLPEAAQAAEPGFSSRDFRDAMGRFASGVVVLSTSTPEDGHHAMTANAFMSGSLAPALVVVSVAHAARMHERIQQAGWFGISILSHEQRHVSNHFAGKPCQENPPVFDMLGQGPVVANAVMQLGAKLRHAYACGDHTLFVGEVTALKLPEQCAPPLVYHSGRYNRLAE